MVMIKQGQFGKTGVDVLDWQDMKGVGKEGYIAAHMLGIATRSQRRRMYFCMLKQAIKAQNDKLAEFAFQKCLIFLNRDKETESEAGRYPSTWSTQREAESIRLQYRVVRFCRAVLESCGMYERIPADTMCSPSGAKVYLEKTWNLVVREIIAALKAGFHGYSDWGLPVEEGLIDSAFNLLIAIRNNRTAEKAFWSAARPYGIRFAPVNKEVFDVLKNTVNGMTLERVVFFLRKYPEMPDEWLTMFKIEFVRKGGVINIEASLPR